MKNFKTHFRVILIMTLVFGVFSCNNTSKKKTVTQPEKENIAATYWALEAVSPEGKTLAIKAQDGGGNLYDVKAIQDADQSSFLDIKAFVGDKKLPVKVLLSKNDLAPVKAIDKGGISYEIVALTEAREKYVVNGVKRFGNIIEIKAIDKKGKLLPIKAKSPNGEIDNVLGIKINVKDQEMTLNGFPIYAHVKAMHPYPDLPIKIAKKKAKKKIKQKELKFTFWDVFARDSTGEKFPVKAVDTLGNQYEVKAVQDSEQFVFMNVKAVVDGKQIPIKIAYTEAEKKPLKAIGFNGTLYDIKVITKDGKTYPVMGVSTSGNIVHVKAVTESGNFLDVKAFSPNGIENDVKGIKIFKRPVEMRSNGVEVYAHVKAIKQ